MSVTFDSNGLSTFKAMNRLVDQIEFELHNCKCSSHGFHGFKLWLKESFSHKSVSSTFQWPSVLMLFTCSTAILVASILKNDNFLLNESIFLYAILLVNIVLVGFETKLRHQEIHTKTGLLASKIRNSLLKNESIIDEWKTGKYYPHLHLQSPCISLQWTFRDNIHVNLPVSLLVKGDIILLCPGHIAPAHCQSLQALDSLVQNSEQNLSQAHSNPAANKVIELRKGDYFAPIQQEQKGFSSNFNNPRIRKAAMPMKFRLLETPFIPLLRLTLDKSCKRPVTSYEKERFAIMVKYVEHIIAPVLLLISILISCTHYLFLSNESHEIDFRKKNLEWIWIRPAMITLPILPLMSPLSWILLNTFGYAKLYLAAKREKHRHNDASRDSFDSPGNNLDSPTSKTNSSVQSEQDPAAAAGFCSGKKQLLSTMKRLILNQDENLWRSANLLQVFGSITALSCVDKKGILSTPNPTADKVFFLNSTEERDGQPADGADGNQHAELGSQDNLINLEDKPEPANPEANNNLNETADLNKSSDDMNNNPSGDGGANVGSKLNKKSSVKKKSNKSRTQYTVLDVTPDKRSVFGLQFDDPDWQRYLSNLKPLGLAILLNTCNAEGQDEYYQFCNHIGQESLLNETSVPVVNKRCLCEFARQIGFKPSAATNDFHYLHSVFSYRHIKPEVIQQGRLAKSLNLPRLKMPFPNLSSAVIKDSSSNSYFLFSQGTCDLALDTTCEFWDGEDLCLLSQADKKAIVDFYHRSSLTANCMAFCYVPLSKPLDRNVLDDNYIPNYIEFPPDSSHLFKSQKNLKLANNEQKTIQSHHLSTDSLTMKDVNKDKDSSEEQRPKSSLSNHSTDGQNLDLILNQLCNQVFIGMVQMQYHACLDFVHLVEILEKACVRFVHFSKENELRSRTFSEKMGLESGWNCNITLGDQKKIKCENPGCRVMNCDGTKCLPNLPFPMKKPLAMNISDHSNVNFSCANLQRSQSAPSYVNTMNELAGGGIGGDKPGDDSQAAATPSQLDFSKRLSNAHESSFNVSDDSIADRKKAHENGESKQLLTGSPASSRFSDSVNDKQTTAPIAFDISNRAKLPEGIENIRPHLENVDNVPLLVSLFTDCTPETTCEMIKIMQEHGEVVCVIGSSSNLNNIPVFLQADTSIGIQPLFPQVCITIPVTEANGEIPFKEFVSPIDLSRELISLPCALHIYREDVVSLSKLICYCRNFMLNARNYIQFYVSCCLSLALAQLCTSLLFLPPLLAPGHMLFCCCFVIPVLSYSLMGAELNDPAVMHLAMGKNQKKIMSKSSILYFLLCYLLKFGLSACIVVFNFAALIYNYNELNASRTKHFFMIDTKEEILKDFDTWSFYLFCCQTFSVFFFVLYFVIISLGFVYRSHLLWQKSPLNNKFWFITSIFILFVHFLFCITIVQIFKPSSERNLSYYLSTIPTFISVIALVWPIPLISFNSLVKRKELKIYGRQQRRARLDFGTKLGMNSPW